MTDHETVSGTVVFRAGRRLRRYRRYRGGHGRAPLPGPADRRHGRLQGQRSPSQVRCRRQKHHESTQPMTISRGPEKGRSLMGFPTLNRRGSVSIVILVIGLACFGSLPLVEARHDDAATPSPVSSSLQWGPCDDVPDAECSRIDVPIDPVQPDGDQLSLRLARLPALDPGLSHGSLLFIPGGPGVGITAAGGRVWRPAVHPPPSMSCGRPSTSSPTIPAASAKAVPSTAPRDQYLTPA